MVVNIKVLMDSISSVLAFGASKIEGAGHTPQADIREPHSNVRISARLEMPHGMLLERAIGTDQARPSGKLGRHKMLH